MKTKLLMLDLPAAREAGKLRTYQQTWSEIRYILQNLQFELQTGARRPSSNNLYDFVQKGVHYAQFEITP